MSVRKPLDYGNEMSFKIAVGIVLLALVWIVIQAEDLQFVEGPELSVKQNSKISLQTIKKNIEKLESPIKDITEFKSEKLNLAPDSISVSQNFSALGFGSADGGASAGNGLGSSIADFVKQTKESRSARLLEQSKLIFPNEARKQNISGFVNLKILIGVSGGVDRVEVVNADPPGFFEKSAIESIKNWKFEPAFNEGQAQASWIAQKIKFELE